MALRLLEIVLPEEDEKAAEDLLNGFDIIHFWHEKGHEQGVFLKLLLSAEKTEPVLDALEKRFSSKEAFRITLLPVEASIPRPEPVPESPVQEKEVQHIDDHFFSEDMIFSGQCFIHGHYLSRRFKKMQATKKMFPTAMK